MAADLLPQTPTEVAASCADANPGYELISYGEIGIPFFDLRLGAEVLDHKPLDPFEEFLLRAVRNGVDDIPSMERLLGLEARVLETALVSLVTADRLRGASSEEVALTEIGEEALREAAEVQIKMKQVRVVYDPLSETVIEPFGFLQPRELAKEGVREVAVPASLIPELHQLDVGDVERVLRRIGGGREQTSDILSLRTMRRFRVFKPAVAMVYRTKGTNDTVVEVAFGGRVSDRHSRALAELGLKDKIGAKQAGKDRLAPRISGVKRSSVQPDSSQLRTLAPYQLPAYIYQALDQATEHVVVTSPGLQGAVLDEELMARLTRCIERGVSVHIGWGYEERARERSDPEVIKALDALAGDNPNLNVRQFARGSDNVLICDDRFMIVSDFRWLSYLGDPNRDFGDERGLMVTNSAYVEDRADKWIGRLTSRSSAEWISN